MLLLRYLQVSFRGNRVILQSNPKASPLTGSKMVKNSKPRREIPIAGFFGCDSFVWEISRTEQDFPFGLVQVTWEIWKYNDNNLIFVASFAEKEDAIRFFSMKMGELI